MRRPDKTSTDKCSVCSRFTLSASAHGISLPEGTFCGTCLSELVRMGLKQRARQTVRWYYSISFVILMLLLLGPFGLPFLWRSDKFNLPAKIILTLIVAVLTVLVIISTTVLIKKTSDYFQSVINPAGY